MMIASRNVEIMLHAFLTSEVDERKFSSPCLCRSYPLHGMVGRHTAVKELHLISSDGFDPSTNCNLEFEVLTAVAVKCSVFVDITPLSPLKISRRFEGLSPPSSG
jgi:hypothetical protein